MVVAAAVGTFEGPWAGTAGAPGEAQRLGGGPDTAAAVDSYEAAASASALDGTVEGSHSAGSRFLAAEADRAYIGRLHSPAAASCSVDPWSRSSGRAESPGVDGWAQHGARYGARGSEDALAVAMHGERQARTRCALPRLAGKRASE